MHVVTLTASQLVISDPLIMQLLHREEEEDIQDHFIVVL